MRILRRATPILAGVVILSCVTIGRFRAAPQLAPAHLDEPAGVGPALSRPGARVAWLSGLNRLSDPAREDDFPSVAVAPDGTVWAAWASYSGLYDEIRARAFRNGGWSTSFPIPGVTGDVWMPQVAVDAAGHPWFVWAQQVDYPTRDAERVNWDLFAASLQNGRWTRPERLTTDPGPDINHRLKRDAQGRLWLVWQGFRNGQSGIFLKYLDGGRWSQTQAVTEDAANQWYPDVAVDSKGTAWIAWDTYRNDSYDVQLRSFRAGQLGKIEEVAATAESEANAAIAIDKQDRPWIAYDQMGVGWGKDQGAAIRQNPAGVALNRKRQLRVVVRTSSGWMQPAEQPFDSMPPGNEDNNHLSRLYTDGDGRIWIEYRHKTERPATWSRPWQVQTEQVQNMSAVRGFWQTYVTYYQGSSWIPVTQMPRSMDRISSYADMAPAPNGQMWMLWHTDNRASDQVQVPVKNEIWSAVLTPAIPAVEAKLDPVPAAAPPKTTSRGHTDEAGDVRAIRAHRVSLGGAEHRIVRGDLHRHTELSTDGGGRNDGSLVDFFRYMIDAASMDFGAITDHNAGGDNEYWWWFTNKLTDIYFVPGRYVPLFGYERSATFPNGHRNILHPYRNIPIVKFHFRGDVPEYWSTYEAVSRDMVENETQMLYDHIRRTGGIAISHTSATNMGTDWRDNDKELEPVVEIYQGARTNYEHEGAPRSAPRPAAVTPQSQYRPEGYIWNAWKKGYRLGVEASSDHGSTHMSYSMVVTDKPTRMGIMDAIRKRHTYAATDNIVVEFWMGDHFMGDEFRSADVPPIRIKARGTAKVAKVSIVRNAKYIYETRPGQQQVSIEYRDNSPEPGTSYYYARIEQEDGQIAWASPIWVTR